MKPTVLIQAGIVIIYGSSLDAAPHSHHAMQVIWPQKNSNCKFNGNEISELIIIDSKIEHQLQMSKGWVFLIEPKSDLGQELFRKLGGKSFKTFSSATISTIGPPTQEESLAKFLIPLFKALKLTSQSLLNNKSTVKDKRIQQILTELDLCLHGKCIKPSNWRASEVAGQLALSESRFLHLFSEELGIAWRPYLLWRRMICAIQAIINNTSATEAAHLAGFSDSSHLSRTFRNTFGMTIRQALTLFKKS
ncbi:helix-turn-helix transcriptional regulator [Pseudoalteromonas denitrificans]|jgi:AraC-like DNA-binding protein|uniref:Transcriptional regulator, AraC family n=1 Tax=Pseudoalteromonas denitrificans DSM 6059 TaxID=1123010 RepID=A0A1I1I3I4_9GAMM|nr:helix-turn-helix transcriptional regulator [Pseudoalteromonas denitrificans]SFC30989.1 transcriptional regulator, AraC family [Pseudoalteromonas denitrificans DSM 6059]